MSDWIIPTTKPGSDKPNPPALVDCLIFSIVDKYVFFGPDGEPHAATKDPQLPELPFRFPIFLARLNGPTEEAWYITVTQAGHEVAKGTWSNQGYTGPRDDDGDADDDDDTWVAHAGATFGEKDKGEAAAASASSNPH
jgi:hypothetical protein